MAYFVINETGRFWFFGSLAAISDELGIQVDTLYYHFSREKKEKVTLKTGYTIYKGDIVRKTTSIS